MRECAVASHPLCTHFWALSGHARTAHSTKNKQMDLPSRTNVVVLFEDKENEQKKCEYNWMNARGIHYVGRPVRCPLFLLFFSLFSSTFCLPPSRLDEKKCPNTFACIIKNVLKTDFITALSQYECCHCSIRARRNRLRLR